MLTWVLVNTVLSLLALGFALLNQGAPHRLRFHICFVALLCWLMPWAQVPQLLPQLAAFDFGFNVWQAEQQLIASTASVTQVPLIVIDTRNVPLANDVTLLHVPLLLLAMLLLTGLVLFGWNVLQHHLRLRSLKRTARDGSGYWQQYGIETSVPILLQRTIGGAFSSGVLRPVIWVHEDLLSTRELPTLLRHELTHIQQHDNWYLLAITLVEKLLWWNPLAWYLGKQSRVLQEHSCDERCRAFNADYAMHLAQLMLANAGITRATQQPLLLSANIFNTANLNIQRLKVLQRSQQMKLRHVVSAIATAVLAVATVGLVTAQPETQEDVLFVRKAERIGVAVDAEGTELWRAEDFDPASALVHTETYNSFGLEAAVTAQFIRVEKAGDNAQISFSFNDVALPFALRPLAAVIADPDKLMTFVGGPTGVAGEPRVFNMVRRMGEGEAGMRVQRLDRGAAGGIVTGGAVRVFEGRVASPGEVPSTDFPLPPNLVLEDDSARVQHVTVSGENLSFDDAIDLIAKASGCNIFKDGNNIVVDYCPQQ